MNFDLSDEQRLLRDTVRDFAREEVRPVAEELDRTKSFPYEIVAKLGKLGLMGIPFPEEYGGGGADNLAYALAIEELARVDSSVGITVAAHTSLGTMPINLWGTDEQKSEWMPALCTGERLAAFGLTGAEAGAERGKPPARGRRGRRQHPHPRSARRWRVGDRRREAVHHQLWDRHLRMRDDHRGHERGERQPRDLEHHRPQRHPRLS